MTITRLQAGPRMSQAVVHGATIYLAGQVADQAKGKSVGEQTTEILAKIDALLKSAGSDKSRILSANVWLADIGRFAEMVSAEMAGRFEAPIYGILAVDDKIASAERIYLFK